MESNKGIRINKYLAMCKVASRRKCDDIIKKGKVKINGEIVSELATFVMPGDIVEVYGNKVSVDEDRVYYILNKPEGVISAAQSKYGEETVVDLIKEKGHRLFPVGRLDKDTTGLIILTNDGDFAYKITHPKFEKEKTYEALIKGKLLAKEMKKLENGVEIDGKITSGAGVKLLKMKGRDSIVEITVIEGWNRQVRKMFSKVGHDVIRLKRTKEAGLTLGDLKEGEYRRLSRKDAMKLIK